MKGKFVVAIMVAMTSCSGDNNRIGDYVYLEHNRKIGAGIIHLDKQCGKSEKILYPSAELYQFAKFVEGHWIFRYRGTYVPLEFCASCVSENQMYAISDSISSRQENFDSEEIQEMIDELTKMRDDMIETEQYAPKQ